MAKKLIDPAALEHAYAKAMNFGSTARIRLYNRLYRFTSREYDLSVALQGMLTRFQRKSDPRRVIWRRWIGGLREGLKFHQVMGPYVPPAERMMLSAGEESGSLAEGFRQAEYVADATKRMRGALFSSLAYPAVLCVLLCLVLYLVAARMMPTLETVLEVEKWPGFAQTLYHVSGFIRDWGLWLGLTFIGLIVLIIKTFPTWTGGVRRVLDRRVLPWTIHREFAAANFLISLAALVSTGRPIDEALIHIRRVATPWLAWHVDRFRMQMRMGVRPERAIDTGLYSDEVAGDLEDYGAAGAFEEAIEAVGKNVVEDAIRSIQLSARMINVLVLVAVAGVMVWMYASMAFVGMEVQKNASAGPL
jgi:type II secretory pathway component PulF